MKYKDIVRSNEVQIKGIYPTGPGNPITIEMIRKFGVFKMYPITDGQMERLNNSFTYHVPKDSQPARYVLLRDQAKDLAVSILQNVPDGRERSLAITKLEECIMWANKGIACGE